MAQSTVRYPKKDVVDVAGKEPTRVLHIDDEPWFLKAAKQILEMQGAFQVDTALSVEEAREKMEKRTYDAVVCDYVMPGKDGLEFLKELRDCGNNIPFILFTGKGREEVAIKSLNLGADRYCNKIGHPETVYGELAHSINQAVERKRAEKEIHRQTDILQKTFNSMTDAIFILDAKVPPTILECNDTASTIFGYEKTEMLGKTTAFLHVSNKTLKEFQSLLYPAIEKGHLPFHFSEFKMKRSDGSTFPSEHMVAQLLNEKGKRTGWVSLVRDITERKKAEEELKESEEKWRSLAENVPAFITILDRHGKILFVNRTIAHTKRQIVGTDIFAYVFPEYHYLLNKKIGQVFKTGKAVRCLTSGYGPKGKGTIALYDDYIAPIMRKGKVVSVIMVSQDVTERKKAEDHLLYQASLLQSVSDAVIATDLDFRIKSWNKAGERIYGWKEEEVIGKTVADVTKGEYLHDKHDDVLKQFWRDGYWKGEVVQRHKNGEALVIQASVSLIKDSTGNRIGAVAVNRDVTDHKKAQIALRESEEKLRNIFESANDCIFYLDKSGRIIDVNRKAVQLFGRLKKELFGRHFAKLGAISPQDIPAVMKAFAQSLAGKQHTLNVCIKDKRGQSIPLECSSSLIKADGKITGMLVIARNITERKKTLEKLETMNEKLAVVGGLTRHDVRNELSAVTMNVFLAKQKLASDHEALKHLKEIESACARMERIFDFARIYEKLGMEELAYMDVEKTLGEAVMLFSDLHGVKVVNDCCGLVMLADSMLRQLFYNLIDNSLKHGEKVSQIRLYYKKAGNDQLKLIYEDDGFGIPKVEKEKIFKEGYGKHSGYGLYLARKICDVYGWSIQETGKHGEGAQFTITVRRKKRTTSFISPMVIEDKRTMYAHSKVDTSYLSSPLFPPPSFHKESMSASLN